MTSINLHSKLTSIRRQSTKARPGTKRATSRSPHPRCQDVDNTLACRTARLPAASPTHAFAPSSSHSLPLNPGPPPSFPALRSDCDLRAYHGVQVLTRPRRPPPWQAPCFPKPQPTIPLCILYPTLCSTETYRPLAQPYAIHLYLYLCHVVAVLYPSPASIWYRCGFWH